MLFRAPFAQPPPTLIRKQAQQSNRRCHSRARMCDLIPADNDQRSGFAILPDFADLRLI